MSLHFSSVCPCTGWTLHVCEERVVVCKMDTSRSVPDLLYSLLIEDNFKWKVNIYGRELPLNICRLTADMPTTMSTALEVIAVIQTLNRSFVCIGNSDDK